MGDLFQEKSVVMNQEQRMLRAIFGDGEETWLKREAEAADFLSEYIGRNPEDLEDAVITPKELRMYVRNQMENLRRDYIADSRKQECGEDDAFAYVKQILVLGVLRWIIESFEEKEGNCFIHLCDKGCEAVQSIMKNRKEDN